MNPSSGDVLRALSDHEHRAAIAARVGTVLLAVGRERRQDWLSGETVAELDAGGLPPLSADQADTPFGNALAVVDSGARAQRDWLLLGAALALHCVSSSVFGPESDAGAESDARAWTPDSWAAMMWLATETPCNPFLFIDGAAESELRPALWGALDKGFVAASHPQKLAMILGLRQAVSVEADEALSRWLETSVAPVMTSLLSERDTLPSLEGELDVRRRGPVFTVLAALSGWMFLRSIWGLFARYVLGLRRPARLTISPRGVELDHQLSMLGRTVRRGQRFLPLDQLGAAEREVRLHGAGLYAGLFALAFGTYVGTGLVLDGLRVVGGSPSLLGVGLGLIAVGIVLDFALTRLSSFRQGRVRMILDPVRGRSIAVSRLAAEQADQVLSRLKAFRTAAK